MDFDATFDQHYPGLLRYCRRLTGDPDVADDIAQESMVRLFDRGISGPDAGIRAWLYKTATHLVRDRHRVGRNRLRLLEERPFLPSQTDAPDRSLERLEARTRARDALNELAPRDREILLMRYSGFTYTEIAHAVDVSPTSIGTLLARAEKRFTDALTVTEEVP